MANENKANWTNENAPDRLGRINDDGTRVWPKYSISGNAYGRTQSTVSLNNTTFVVLDSGINPSIRDALLAQAQEHLAPKRKAKSSDESS